MVTGKGCFMSVLHQKQTIVSPVYSIMAMFTVLVTLLFTTQTFGLTQYEHSVKVLHYILPHWGESVSGLQECGNIACDWTHSEHVKQLKDNLYFTEPRNGVPTLSLAMYNIHSLWERMRILHPLHCDLKTNLTMTESEESKVRYGYLFDQGYKNFDGYTSTSPNAAVQRVYIETHLNSSHFLAPLNFSTLIKGASYVASDCHRHDSANADRDSVVHRIRQEGFRVDGLGTLLMCHGFKIPASSSSSFINDIFNNMHIPVYISSLTTF